MGMDRRDFLKGMLGAGVGAAITFSGIKKEKIEEQIEGLEIAQPSTVANIPIRINAEGEHIIGYGYNDTTSMRIPLIFENGRLSASTASSEDIGSTYVPFKKLRRRGHGTD